MSEISSGNLKELLSRCSSFPWNLSCEASEWSLLDSKKNLKRRIIPVFPKGMSAYDRRLLALAPLLAIEILKLRSDKGAE